MKKLISQLPEGLRVLECFERRLRVANRSEQTIRNYIRGVRGLMEFHGCLPRELEIDQVIDFLHDLQVEKQRNWRTIKIYVAGLRWYYQHMAEDVGMASQIPYPKEKPTLPQVLSREELTLIFNSCLNKKHRVMFRLLYSSGLRRGEILRLKITDLLTKDGKCQLRINQSKGGKDRLTVLSEKVLIELREYYRSYRPKIFLFNGRLKGTPMSAGGLRHALNAAVKRAGINKEVNLHILRHCFASHALEEGINLKTLQHLMGHSSIQTTIIYLHISDVPLIKAFSPLDSWEK
ncbi:tyrosine-type recombinase/integrase [Flexithrix dorotheae]|uniref:tyrosine-type recombinase/integrase n=1 Tax=Flexithrix dorotheae TaxID=70993 RepID=UPI00036D4C0A|nr:tyrosine-type recombinase/integrase [Flexithrix dorotheae]